jgi:cell division protein FtsI (penicillin-binding protein 3)
VSAPVFAEVAQQVLEYLSVPHDIELSAPKTPLKTAKAEKPVDEDDANVDQVEVNALFAAANDLPADDPLRQSQQATAQPSPPAAQSSTIATGEPAAGTPAPGGAVASNTSDTAIPTPPERSNYVTISDGKKLSVPTLIGLPIRTVIEMTAAAGLQVQISGSGTVREQAPAPGTKVPSGTKIIVRCGR